MKGPVRSSTKDRRVRSTQRAEPSDREQVLAEPTQEGLNEVHSWHRIGIPARPPAGRGRERMRGTSAFQRLFHDAHSLLHHCADVGGELMGSRSAIETARLCSAPSARSRDGSGSRGLLPRHLYPGRALRRAAVHRGEDDGHLLPSGVSGAHAQGASTSASIRRPRRLRRRASVRACGVGPRPLLCSHRWWPRDRDCVFRVRLGTVRARRSGPCWAAGHGEGCGGTGRQARDDLREPLAGASPGVQRAHARPPLSRATGGCRRVDPRHAEGARAALASRPVPW